MARGDREAAERSRLRQREQQQLAQEREKAVRRNDPKAVAAVDQKIDDATVKWIEIEEGN